MNLMQSMNTLLAAGALLAADAAGQDLLPKGAPQRRPIVIQGATLHTVANGVIENGSLSIVDGKIAEVSKTPIQLDDAEYVDGKGKHVYPGFVLATSTLGLVEVESVDMTIDMREAGTYNPEVYAAVAVNPDSWWIPVARRNGVLAAGVFPQGGVIPGRASVIQLDGWTWEDMALARDAGLAINWPFASRGRFGRGGTTEDQAAERVERIDALFDAAEAYLGARAADPAVESDLRYESMRSVIEGRTRLFVSATTRPQAESAIRWAAGRGLKVAIAGGRDVLQFTDLLKRHDVMVAVTGTHRLPHRRDLSYRTTYELPKQLEEAGVKWCLTMRATDSANARNLCYEAAATVAHGLDPEVALRSITLSAAEFLGMGERLGSLEAGKDGTLFVADGDPFEFTTSLERAWVQGRATPLDDKQTALYRKYREKYRQLGKLKK